MNWIIFLLGLFIGLYIQQFINGFQTKIATLIMGSKEGIAFLNKSLEKSGVKSKFQQRIDDAMEKAKSN